MKNPMTQTRTTLLWVAAAMAVAVWVLRDLALLVGYSVLLAYSLLPVVNAIERVRDPRGRHLPRGIVAGGLMLSLVAIVGWMLALAVPRLATEATHFAAKAPEVITRLVQDLRAFAAARGLSDWIDPTLENLNLGSDGAGILEKLGPALAPSAGGLFGGIGQVLGLALLPLLAFYLLAESDAVQMSALRFVPEGTRSEIARLGGAVDRALRSYVRGQAIVCLVTGAAVSVGLALLHHPVALLLGLLAGAAELIPYLGFMVTAIAIGLAGSSVSPLQALLGLAVYTGINWAIGTLVTPRVMGRYLRMHPFVVTVSVLAGAKLLGPAGALLALPVAAAIQAVIGELAPAAIAARRESAVPPAPAA
jgi:predicted PurR-regulated permease PerM